MSKIATKKSNVKKHINMSTIEYQVQLVCMLLYRGCIKALLFIHSFKRSKLQHINLSEILSGYV
jgi:hypothetical protein